MNNNNRTYNRIISGIILLFTLGSCSDRLDIAPEDKLIHEDFWKKTDDVNSALAATYNAFRKSADESFKWGSIREEMIDQNSISGFTQFATSKFSILDDNISWACYYNTINQANTVLYYSGDVQKNDKSFTQRMRDAVDAEALFLRAFSYFYLIRIWKEVPIYLMPSISDTNDLYLPKQPEHIVIKKIIDDLLVAKDKAYTNEYSYNLRYLKGRANKYAIMSLLADVYLWNEQYQKCIDYCDSVTAAGFSLEVANDWFAMYNPGNAVHESIFEIQFDANLDNQSSWDMFNIYNNLSKSTLISDYLSEQGDIRLCYPQKVGPVWKYLGYDVNTDKVRPGSDMDENVIYYRYADIILMKAECLVELGGMSKMVEVRDLVNKVHFRSASTLISDPISTKEELRKFVLDERAREFAFEGKRSFDLLRAAKRNHFENKAYLKGLITRRANPFVQEYLSSALFDTMSYYMPVPSWDLKYNTKLKQNPFYSR